MESGGCAPDAAGPSAIISVAGTPHAETHHLLPLPPPHTRRQKTARGNLLALVFVLPSLTERFRGKLVAVDDEGSTESSSMQLNRQPQQYQAGRRQERQDQLGPASPLAAETLRSRCCPAAFDADASTVFSNRDFRRCIVAAVPAIPSVTQVAALVPESASRERLPSFAVVRCRPRASPATETARGCRYHAVV
ncbi:hypothetical protein DFJ73DRAFT_862004 [Zopfochytrium polystomum]|nr:hypothetical protein DFJ73DRAFT_862004 [Zopfochytrium polystomum]